MLPRKHQIISCEGVAKEFHKKENEKETHREITSEN